VTAAELHARLTAASAVLGDYQRQAVAALAGAPELDWPTWAQRLAVELKSVTTALRGALSMLDDADDVLNEQDSSMVLGTGGLSVSVEDAPVVMAALEDAALCAEQEHIPSSPSGEQAARYRELHGRLGGQQWMAEAAFARRQPPTDLPAATHVRGDGTAVVSAADLMTVVAALRDAALRAERQGTQGGAVRYNSLRFALGDDRG
jgi:hypothetical protein